MKENLNITKRKQEDDLIKYMTNAFFYKLKFGTIDWLTNYLVNGQPLIWWLVFDIIGCWLLTLLAGY